MVIRIVRMSFNEEDVTDFLQMFEEVKMDIRTFPGCRHLELWGDTQNPTVFTTYSLWESENALEQYRNSELFKTTWGKTRPLFSAKPMAFSNQAVSLTNEG